MYLYPTRVTGHSQAIIDNIFSNYVSKEVVCGNLTSTISTHLQVLFVPSTFSDNPDTKSNISKRSWTNFNQAEFVMDYFDKDWSDMLNLKHGNNMNVSMENFVNNMNELLDKHASFKKIRKYKLKFTTKPWITAVLQKSVSIKNSLFKKYIKLKSPVKKNVVHQQCKY